jgi:hypothetical protein
MTFKYPGPLIVLYDSQLGKTISAISVALFVEVANTKHKVARIQDYKVRAPMQYDEGGKTSINRATDGG